MLALRALLVTAALLAAAPVAQAEAPHDLITPLAAHVMAPPMPVKGSDGRWHLAYEVHVENWTAAPVTIRRVQVIAGGSGRVLDDTVGEAAVSQLIDTTQFAAPDADLATLAPHEARVLFMNVDVARRALVPRRLVHRILASTAGPGGARSVLMDLARTRVRQARPIVIGPPLRGGNFVDLNGCCAIAPHTTAIQTFDGIRELSQRFAIDWIQLDDQGRTHVGDPHDPASYIIYGKPILAVADATVVSVLDGRPDNPPPAPDRTLTPANAYRYVTGNHVVLDLGGGRYALYAHVQPGSIRVHIGQHVRRGQVVARVGNSGNTSEPHLHFHVADGPAPLQADGLPYEIDRFSLTGRIGGDVATFVDDGSGISSTATVVPTTGPTLRTDELPLMFDVIDFGQP